MTEAERREAARKFINHWRGKGDEKQDCQLFWVSLLQDVYGMENVKENVQFERRVIVDGQQKYIDVYLPETRVMIEQKSMIKDLNKPEPQSGGIMLTPYQQAKRYANNMPLDEMPRYIVTCNFQEFQIHDQNKPGQDPEIIKLDTLQDAAYRMEFLVKKEHVSLSEEMKISMQAGEIVGKLYDAFYKQYKDPTNEKSQKSLNALCVRLVFCLYAEDSGLFGSHAMFHDYLASYQTKHMRNALINLFRVLDQPENMRDPYLDEDLAAFPYVNGGLFSDESIEIPPFTEEIRNLLLQNASKDFDWSSISPTIFGAVFESTLNPETRRAGGMHYTSIENIHKVIDPLFLDDLRAELTEIEEIPVIRTRKNQLEKFQDKLASLTFLDPACGSGNFLTETYLSLRRLENEVLRQRIATDRSEVAGQIMLDFGGTYSVKVSIGQFYGIEINDFAVTVAKTALWISEEQMIRETQEIIHMNIDFLPLKSYANIVQGNALRMDWEKTISKDKLCYIEGIIWSDVADKMRGVKVPASPRRATLTPLILPAFNGSQAALSRNPKIASRMDRRVAGSGTRHYQRRSSLQIKYNPPFLGYSIQSKAQKDDILSIYRDEKGKAYKTSGKIDYVAGWYFKAAQLMAGTNIRAAFVSTNSITQGEQVASVWKPLYERFGIHIDFAHRTFIWDSEANDKAHVHVVIVGFSCAPNNSKEIIFDAGHALLASNINPYLCDAPNVFIESRKEPFLEVPAMTTGNRPADGGHLIIEADDYNDFVKREPKAKKYIKKLVGSVEFINNKKRYCLWLVGVSPAEIKSMPEVKKRIDDCRKARLGGAPDRQKLADTPALFRETKNPSKFIIVPKVSSERRRYIPMGFMNGDTISTDLNFIIPEADIYLFGILESNVHMAWVRSVCGRLKSDYRYSRDIVYNTFPWPSPTPDQKQRIEQTAQGILDARALYPDSSLADLYDPLTMPPELRQAHDRNNVSVMKAYGFSTKMSEAECVSALMSMYKELTSM